MFLLDVYAKQTFKAWNLLTNRNVVAANKRLLRQFLD